MFESHCGHYGFQLSIVSSNLHFFHPFLECVYCELISHAFTKYINYIVKFYNSHFRNGKRQNTLLCRKWDCSAFGGPIWRQSRDVLEPVSCRISSFLNGCCLSTSPSSCWHFHFLLSRKFCFATTRRSIRAFHMKERSSQG